MRLFGPQIRAFGFLLGVVLLSGCSGPNNLPLDAAVLSTSEEGLSTATIALLREAKRHARTRVAGAALGGVAGAVAGIAGGQGQSGAGRGALGAGLSGVGAALGYAFGAYIDARESRAVMDQRKVELLDAAARRDAAQYDEVLDEARRAAERSRRVIQGLRQGDALRQDLVYRGELADVDARRKALEMFERELQDNTNVLCDNEHEATNNSTMDPTINPAPLGAQLRVFQKKREDVSAQRRIAEDQLESLTQRERPP